MVIPGSPEWLLECAEQDHRITKDNLYRDWERLRQSSKAYWAACKAVIEARDRVKEKTR